MPKYCVQIRAQNLLVEMSGKLAKHAFITWKFVEAPDATAAETIAIQMVRDDEELRAVVRNEAADAPTMEAPEIVEFESFEGVNTNLGRIWYEMNPTHWWQFWRRD
jgi:hypothetical protein